MRLRGSLHTPLACALASLGVLALLFWWLLSSGPDPAAGGELVVRAGAGLRRPLTELGQEFERETGTRVVLDLGGSGTLLSSLKVAPEGDLYIPADVSYVDQARAAGLAREALILATMTPVIAVPTGNPQGIEGADDLLRDDVRVGLADPDAAAVGRAARACLADVWEQLEPRVKVFKPTEPELVNDLLLGAVDAVIAWDATIAQHAELAVVPDPRLDAGRKHITAGVLSASERPAAALRFARFCASPERGAPVFARHGFAPTPGDPWVARPALRLMCGAMLQPALRETLAAFAEREGVELDLVYNGCGILVAQMRAGRIPDAYFSCDQTFLDQVQEHFTPGDVVAANRMVLLVPRGNPLGLEDLGDLTRDGLRLGLAHPTDSALGALTRALLEERGLAGLYAEGRVAVWSATGDMLVNQVALEALDATIVYESNAAHVLDVLETVPIDDAAALATQPFAHAKDSPHRELLARLHAHLRTDASRARFEALGFQWRPASTR